MIRAERQRQIEREGFTEADDDRTWGHLYDAALCYHFKAQGEHVLLGNWPWNLRWWKPSPDPIRNFVKAGALYLAEAGRFRRKGQNTFADDMLSRAKVCAAEIDALIQQNMDSPA